MGSRLVCVCVCVCVCVPPSSPPPLPPSLTPSLICLLSLHLSLSLFSHEPHAQTYLIFFLQKKSRRGTSSPPQKRHMHVCGHLHMYTCVCVCVCACVCVFARARHVYPVRQRVGGAFFLLIFFLGSWGLCRKKIFFRFRVQGFRYLSRQGWAGHSWKLRSAGECSPDACPRV